MARPSKYTSELRRRADDEVLNRDRSVTEVAVIKEVRKEVADEQRT